ncbi:MAG: FAD-dependent thymidylate synthase, partial [Candidatus Methanosuratincola sp.]
HEKWVVGYGHASVAEHATVHLGIERVSRLFSSLLELSNEYLSFTEFSQRYQKPRRGDYFIPHELRDKPGLLNEYVALQDSLYEIYTELNAGLIEHISTLREATSESAIEKLAFEDARYALSLATLTNLGLTGNARAIEDALTKLLSSKYKEARERAMEMKEEVAEAVPTLVKYAKESPYIVETRRELESLEYGFPRMESASHREEGGTVRLLDFTGKGSSDPQTRALEKIVRSVIFAYSGLSYDEASLVSVRKGQQFLLDVFRKSVQRMSKHENPLGALRLVSYEAEFTVSEACWHQLLRHRKVSWLPQEPTVHTGFEIPPRIKEAGLEGLLLQAVRMSERLYGRLVGEGLREAASYTVTNAHLRRVIGSFDLWELYHLINLRMSQGAQWDIRNIVSLLTEEVSRYHPDLVKPAIERVLPGVKAD